MTPASELRLVVTKVTWNAAELVLLDAQNSFVLQRCQKSCRPRLVKCWLKRSVVRRAFKAVFTT